MADLVREGGDVILADELKVGYEVKNSMLNEKISKLSKEDQDRIYATIDVLLQFAKTDELTKNETELTETAEATTPIKEES